MLLLEGGNFAFGGRRHFSVPRVAAEICILNCSIQCPPTRLYEVFGMGLHSLSDNVDHAEVERVEQSAEAVLSNMLNVFSGSSKALKPEAKISRRSSFKKLTCKRCPV